MYVSNALICGRVMPAPLEDTMAPAWDYPSAKAWHNLSAALYLQQARYPCSVYLYIDSNH